MHPRAVTASSYRTSGTIENRHQKLIDLLATGHTDASAARQLGVSRRTVTYMLRSMMDELGINNRFQLGIAVGARSRSCETCPEPDRSGGADMAHDHGRY
ncbi:helix-turn-helix transcriptional regulator [Streptomyces misionensis]|uniref:helix-turn-helix transcriptional regulator n=1 Tax=Streptomyces misionensis TaxID=67331 RepID=UPI0036A40EE5